MPAPRPFRFGAAADATASGAEFAERARRVEALGYATFFHPDHFSPRRFAVGPALTAAACATTTLRVGSGVYANDFRHPALLAREAATIDVLSGGRFELGLGTGYHPPDYAQTGIPLDPPGVRVDRLEEAVRIVKGLWADGPLTVAGRHYNITAMEGWPKPLQRPRPPLQIGAGGKRMLALAAREADSVGIIARALPGGGADLAGEGEAALARKVAWVREAAGARFDRLELAMHFFRAVVTDHPRSAAEAVAPARGLTAEQVLASPYFLIGSVEQIVERLLALRERHGVSYFNVLPADVEAFAPVVARLTGK